MTNVTVIERDKEFGKHYIVELLGCNPERISHVEYVKQSFLGAAKESKATIIEHYFHQFEPHGVTGVILLAESHFTIHTWPEENYAAVDIFTCGKMDGNMAVEILKKNFEADEAAVHVLGRGF